MARKVRPYYLHNIDGRRCGMIAVTSKAQVREVIRGMPLDEIEPNAGPKEAIAMAMAEPGALFVASLTRHNATWIREGRRHPA